MLSQFTLLTYTSSYMKDCICYSNNKKKENMFSILNIHEPVSSLVLMSHQFTHIHFMVSPDEGSGS